MAQQQIRLQVNQANLVRNLQHAFSRKDTFIAELMQNARRAGASYVGFAYNAVTRTLTVEDDGCGLDNPQDILTVAESGWDEAVRQEEHPYGLGFLSAVYQADHVEIISKGYRIAFDTEQALGFEPVPVEAVEDEGVTRIRLFGVPEQDEGYEALVRRYARGFPIRVLWEGEDCPRPHALDNPALRFEQTHIGQVYVHELDHEILGTKGTDKSVLYLQGIVVYPERATGDDSQILSTNIVHLDPAKFMGRMPDRDKLVDEGEVVSRVEKTIRRIWQTALAERVLFQGADPREVAQHWYGTLDQWGMVRLLNHIPYVPAHVCEIRSAYPVQNYDWEVQFDGVNTVIEQEEVVSGRQPIADEVDPPYDAECGFQAAMYLRYLGTPILKSRLDERHWLPRHLVRIDQEDITVRVEGRVQEACFQGNWCQEANVLLAEKVVLMGPLGEIEARDAFVLANGFLEDDRGAVWYEDPVVVVPACEYEGDVVRQLVDFEHDWRYDEQAMEAEVQLFEDFLMAQRPELAHVLLRNLLERAGVQRYPALMEHAFRIEIDAEEIRVAASGEQGRLPSNGPAMVFFADGPNLRVFTEEEGLLRETACHEGLLHRPKDLAHVLLREVCRLWEVGELVDVFVDDVLSHRHHSYWTLTPTDLVRWARRAQGRPVPRGRDPLFVDLPIGAAVTDVLVEPLGTDGNEGWRLATVLEGGERCPVIDCKDEGLAEALAERIRKHSDSPMIG